MVTACYGIPDTPYEVKGRVVDAETGKPIQNIKVTVSAGNGYGSTSGVGSVSTPPYSYPASGSTSAVGEFSVTVYEHYVPEGFIVECVDVDGVENGSYESSMEAVPMEKSQDLVVKMTSKN